MVFGEIHIGECDKNKIILDYIQDKEITKIFVIGDELNIDTDIEVETIKFSDTIMYVFYYRLLQEINKNSLVILNQCLRKQNRYDLTYNCIRKYVIQTEYRLIFNYYPLIKSEEDFMILYDMITPNPFLKEQYKYITIFEGVKVYDIKFEVTKTEIEFGNDVIGKYEKEKEIIISQVKKDPDIIPRRLLKWSEKQHGKGFDSMNKIKPHMNVCVSNLKVDKYYYNELLKFKEELENVREKIQH